MKMMQVVPNPYRMLDAAGNPIAVYPCHMKHAPGEYVGASKTLNVLQPARFVDLKTRAGVRREVAEFDRSRAVFTFTTDPVDVPADGVVGAYYRKGVAAGALLPANAETARLCGKGFVPVADALSAARRHAAAEFKREHGDLPAWAQPTKGAAPSAP